MSPSLVSCGLSPREFNEEYAALFCDAVYECETIWGFESLGACKAQMGGYADAAHSSSACEFNEDAAEACLNTLKSTNCWEMLDFDCGGGETVRGLGCEDVYSTSDDDGSAGGCGDWYPGCIDSEPDRATAPCFGWSN